MRQRAQNIEVDKDTKIMHLKDQSPLPKFIVPENNPTNQPSSVTISTQTGNFLYKVKAPDSNIAIYLVSTVLAITGSLFAMPENFTWSAISKIFTISASQLFLLLLLLK